MHHFINSSQESNEAGTVVSFMKVVNGGSDKWRWWRLSDQANVRGHIHTQFVNTLDKDSSA